MLIVANTDSTITVWANLVKLGAIGGSVFLYSTTMNAGRKGRQRRNNMRSQYHWSAVPVIVGVAVLGVSLGGRAIWGQAPAVLLSGPALSAQMPAKNSLYERLGGYDAISAVVDDFAQKLFNDPVVGVRFFGMSDDSRANFRQKNKNLVCNVTGGPCKITSRPANVTHGGLGIKASEFDIVVGHLVSTLDSFNVPEAEQSELLAIIGSLRPDIVEVEDR